MLQFGAGVAAANGGVYLVGSFDTFGTLAGIPYTYPVSVTVASFSAPETQPITLSDTFDPGVTLLSVLATDPNWNCSGTVLSTNTVSCVYTPTSPLTANTTISVNVTAVAAITGATYAVSDYPQIASPDAQVLGNGGTVVQVNPLTASNCKHGGWQTFGGLFKNQGDCVSFVATRGKNPPG